MINRQEYMELLDIIKDSFQKLEERLENQFAQIDQRFISLESRMNDRFDKIEQRLDYHETWLKRIDKKLEDKVDKKDFNFLVKVLEKGGIISASEAHHVSYSEY